MATSLALQLQRLKTPSTAVFDAQKRFTLLFNPKEAAALSDDTIYEIGIEGLEELIKRNQNFSEFQLNLFHKSSRDLDRNMMSKSENKRINETIRKFLIMLSPYALMNPAHKSLEWLFFRYAITEHNKLELLLAFLPYYTSNIFVRVVQACQFPNNDPFQFLETVKQSGLHLQKLTIHHQILANGLIVRNLRSFFKDLLTVHKSHILTNHFNFLCSTICGALEIAEDIQDGFVTNILPLVMDGLSSEVADFASTSYVIVARLCSKVTLSNKLLDAFMVDLSDPKSQQVLMEATLTIVLIYQLQSQYEAIPDDALKKLLANDWLFDCLEYLHSHGNCISAFLEVLLKGALDGNAEQFILNLTSRDVFDEQFTTKFLRLLLDSSECHWLPGVIKLLEQKHAISFQQSVAEISKNNCPKLIKLLENLHEEDNSEVNELFRYQNKEDLNSRFNGLKPSQQYWFINKVRTNLKDSEPTIVQRNIELLDKIDFEAEFLRKRVEDLINSPKLLNNKWKKCIVLAVEYLLKNDDFTWEGFITLFPYMVLFNNKKSVFSNSIFNNSENVLKQLKPLEPEEFLKLKNAIKSNMKLVNQFSTIFIVTATCPSMEFVDDTIGNLLTTDQNDISYKGSTVEDYMKVAIQQKWPSKGVAECIQTLIKKYKSIDFKTADFKTSELSGLVRYQPIFAELVNGVGAAKLTVSLNACASNLLDPDAVLTVSESISSKVTSDLDCLYLLCLLQHDNRMIRSKIFDLSIKSSSLYVELLEKLFKYRNDILVDKDQISMAFYNISNKKFITNLTAELCKKQLPTYLKLALLKLTSKVNNFEMLQSIVANLDAPSEDQIEILDHIVTKLDTAIVNQLTLNSPIMKLMLNLLKFKMTVMNLNGEPTFLPNLLMRQLNKIIVTSDEVSKKLLTTICDLRITYDDPEFIALSNRLFKHIDLNALVVVDVLKAMISSSSGKKVSTTEQLDNPNWKRGVCLLEFLQNKKKIRNVTCLLPILFQILKKCLDIEEQTIVEYTKQLLLSLVLLICSKPDISIADKEFNIELIIQCIRASQNPQTHYHALLVLSHAAKVVPNEVLHHVMAVFTFMGSTLIRHDDAYSFELITKIVNTIIPILVSKERTQTIQDVLRVFVDALLDVPEHRRIPLYTQLFTHINPKENLNVFLLFLLENEVFQGKRERSNKTDKDGLSQRLKIALQLCGEFPIETLLQTSVHLTQYLNELADEKDELDNRNYIVNLKTYTPKQFRHFKYLIITFLSNLLSYRSVVDTVSRLNDKQNSSIETYYKQLIINILSYIQRVQKLHDAQSNNYWKTILHYSYDLLDGVNSLLTINMFLLVVKGLLMHSLSMIKKRALELLNNKLQNDLPQEAKVSGLIKPILMIIEMVHEDELNNEQETLVQTALLSLKLVARKEAIEQPEQFIQILKFIAGVLIADKLHGNVLASVVLCVTELCVVLRGHAIGTLNTIMPAFLGVLKKQKFQETSSLLLMSVITAINKLLDTFSSFLSPYLSKLISESSILISKWSSSSDDPKMQHLTTRLSVVRKKIATTIEPRILIPIIDECYDHLLKKNYNNALTALLEILEEQLGTLQSSEVTPHMSELTNFFLKALTFRSQNSMDVANMVENFIVKCLTVFTLKLSETTFTPFYLRLFDWAVRSDNNKDRLITFYHCSETLAYTLKGLFVLFAGHILTNAAENLKSIISDHTDDKDILLLELILKTLRNIFTYDNKKIINRDRFQLLMQPLVDLLESDLDGLDNLTKRNKNLITPTIVKLALATADDGLWKEMNYQILLKMRSSVSDIRLNALHCLAELVGHVKEDFMPLLPETIPFLAELLEDEDERVENACRTAIREMEKILGEPLQKYF